MQIRDGVDGTIVPPGDAEAIGKALLDYYNKKGVHKPSRNAKIKQDGNDKEGDPDFDEKAVEEEEKALEGEDGAAAEKEGSTNIGLKRASTANNPEVPLGGRWTTEGAGPKEELFTVGNATMWQVS